MRLKTFIIIGLLGFVASAAPLLARMGKGKGSGSLPPVGERTYVIEPDSASPVAIEGKEASSKGAKVLKDPVNSGKVPKLERVEAHHAPAPKPKVTVATVKSPLLKFRKMSVSGHLRQPRVEFKREFLPVDRADEPVSQDFYQKVFAPARDDAF